MFCKNCGAQLADNVKFCQNCGAPVEATQQPDNAQSNTYAAPDYTQPQGTVPPVYEAPNYTQSQPQPQFFDCGVQPRDIATAIILSIVTCGIYNIYWFVKQVDDVNRVANDQNAFSGGVTFLLGLVTCGIYTLYWFYQAGKKISYAQQVRGLPVKDNLEILYLLLGLFGFGIVSMALIQSDLNKMATPNA